MNPDFENYSNLRQQIRRSLTNWRDRLTRLGSDSLYLFLSAAAFAPAAMAMAQGQPAGMELMWLLSNMGSNLLANVVQKFRDAPDEAAAMAMLQEALAAAPALQAELDAVLSRLETLTVAQEALPVADRDGLPRRCGLNWTGGQRLAPLLRPDIGRRRRRASD
jgi:hypothetical protein